jgi:hypothetical protein
MTEDRKAKMLERVRALLAKANATNFPEEADAFRAKADEIMTAYAIEQWQVDAAQAGVGKAVMPERRDVNLNWYYNTPFRNQLWWIFNELATHCRCTVVARKAEHHRGGDYMVPVLGLPSDLDYLDMLFTNIMFDFTRKIDPKPDPKRLSYYENLAMLKEAGLGWPAICRLMVEAGMLEYKETGKMVSRYDYATGESRDEFVAHTKPWEIRKNYAKPAHDYRNWCKREGVPQSYTDPRTYRRNFAEGYEDALSSRLRKLRMAAADAYDANHEAGGMSLVLRDIKQVIKEFMWDEFPDLRPHPPECECDNCHVKKCDDPKCTRPRCKAKRKPVRYRAPVGRKVDWAARAAGEAAGREVRIENNQNARMGGAKKELES